MNKYILVINTGSTSTKVGVYFENKKLLEENITHQPSDLNDLTIGDQSNLRKEIITKILKQQRINFNDIKIIIARGGLLRAITSGTYIINDAMIDDLTNSKYGYHASNLAALIAIELSKDFNVKAYINNPVVVDEMWPIAKITGVKHIKKKSIFHALNHKKVTLQVAKNLNKLYEDCNFIVAHLGGGISIGCHYQGKVVDVNNALNGEGPFSIQRAGTLPTIDIINECYQSDLSQKTIEKLLFQESGIYSYFGTTNLQELVAQIQDNDEIKLIVDAMIYQVAKTIASYGATLKGKIDYIILTGGIAYSEYITNCITDYVSWMAPVKIIAGENEMLALSEVGLRILNEAEAIFTY